MTADKIAKSLEDEAEKPWWGISAPREVAMVASCSSRPTLLRQRRSVRADEYRFERGCAVHHHCRGRPRRCWECVKTR